MRVSDLIGAEVRGPNGRPGAVVTDVRLIADGPPRGLTGSATLRLDGLVLSRHHVGSLLGYDRTPGIGPWLVAAIVRRMHREMRYAEWTHVAKVEEHCVHLDVDPSELPPVD
jgi:hypothetical protein